MTYNIISQDISSKGCRKVELLMYTRAINSTVIPATNSSRSSSLMATSLAEVCVISISAIAVVDVLMVIFSKSNTAIPTLP